MGAGIIIVKYENGLPLFLGLEARKNDQIKHGGKYDLPKGMNLQISKLISLTNSEEKLTQVLI